MSTLQELDNPVVGAVLDRPDQVEAINLQLRLPDDWPLLQG